MTEKDVLEKILHNTQKYAVNAFRAIDYENPNNIDDDNFIEDVLSGKTKFKDLVEKPVLYRRSDLSTWAKEACDRGEKFFYAEPDDPLNPYGPMHLCEPRYKYIAKYELSEEEYNLLSKLKEE